MDIEILETPHSLSEAFGYITQKGAFPVAGFAWSRMNQRKVALAVDLSALGLRFIKSNDAEVEAGAMTTARDVEMSPELSKVFGSFFSDSVAHIVGVQMRNVVTVGGTVAGRYGFSDLNTALLAADAKVVLYEEGPMSFADFIERRGSAPFLLEKVTVPVFGFKGRFLSIRNTKSDMPILNAAAAFSGNRWRIAVGARPGACVLAVKASDSLGSGPRPDSTLIAKAASLAAAEISFGSDIRADADYRKSVCEVLVRRAIEEASK